MAEQQQHPIDEPADVGATLAGRYLLVRELGRGGMGRVFLARDAVLQREVAVKIVGDAAADPEGLKRFEQEARSAGALSHPNVVTVFDIGWEGRRPFIVSELLHGITLRERMERGPIPQGEIVQWVAQLALGLAAAHAKGIVHRDLKPANLFLTEAGPLKILDFGVAKLLQQPAAGATAAEGAASVEAPQTAAGRTMGTVGYMSPEQVRGQPVDDRSDVFSVGILLLELLTGKRPFQRGSPFETAYAVLSDPAPHLPPECPPALDRVAQACLRKAAAERPPAAELARELRELAGSGGPISDPRTPTVPQRGFAGPPQERPVVRRTALVAGVAGSAVVLAVLLAPSVARLLTPSQGGGGTRHKTATPARAPPVAVLPFALEGAADGALAESIAGLLSRELGQDGITCVDPQQVLAAVHSPPAAGEAAASLARRLGAESFVTGTLRREGDRLHAEAALFDVASPGVPRARAASDGAADQLLVLATALISQLRPALPLPGGSRLARLARRTAGSEEALQAWLEGEALMLRGERKAAAAPLRRAVAADDQFALAHYLLAVALAVREPGAAIDAQERATRYGRSRLQGHDLKLIETWSSVLAGRADEAERRYRELVAEQPDDAEAWYQLGEVLFHWNPIRGRSAQEAADPFGRAVLLAPEHGAALEHLIGLAMIDAQRPLTLALTSRFLEGERGEGRPSIRWLHAWAAGDQAERAEVLEIFKRDPKYLGEAVAYAAWERDGLADARELAQLLANTEGARLRDLAQFFLGMYEVALGRPEAGRAILAKVSAATTDAQIPFYYHWLDTLEGLPQASPAQLQASREAVRRLGDSPSPITQEHNFYLRGLLAAQAHDTSDLAQQVEALSKVQSPGGGSTLGDLVLSLRAHQADAEGRSEAALALVDQLQLQIPYRVLAGFAYLSPRTMKARILAQQGHSEEALRLEGLADFYEFTEPVLLPLRTWRRAQLLERLGERSRAADEYALFAILWRDCEPALRPQVDEARAKERALREPAALAPTR